MGRQPPYPAFASVTDASLAAGAHGGGSPIPHFLFREGCNIRDADASLAAGPMGPAAPIPLPPLVTWNPGAGEGMKEIFRRHPRSEEHFEKSADNIWVRCPRCRELVYSRELEQSIRVCPKCRYHHPINARERLDITLDPDTFHELDTGMTSVDPLDFASGRESYAEKLEQYRARSEAQEAFIYGTGKIDGQDIVVGASEFDFGGGSMGAVSGEKVARAMELAIDERLPLILFSTGGGQECRRGRSASCRWQRQSPHWIALKIRDSHTFQ